MTGALYRIGRFCVRRRWLVIALWAVVFVLLASWARAVGEDVNDNLTLPGRDSQNATDLLQERFPSEANGTNPVVLRAPSGKSIKASEYKQPIDDTVKALRGDPDVRKAVSPLGSDGSSLVSSKQKSIAYIELSLKPSPSELSVDDAERIVALADPARKAGLDGA
jgi:putative drug exporter of the RND superfamily